MAHISPISLGSPHINPHKLQGFLQKSLAEQLQMCRLVVPRAKWQQASNCLGWPTAGFRGVGFRGLGFRVKGLRLMKGHESKAVFSHYVSSAFRVWG